MDNALLVWGLLFGATGMGILFYGKRQRDAVSLVFGVALVAAPYVIADPSLLLAFGIAVVSLLYFLRQ